MGRPRKVMPNPNRHILQDCYGVFKLRHHLPRKMARDLDDIIAGVTRLDFGGNARPISRQLILDMLRDLDEISVQSVQEYTKFSLSYSEKLTTVMRITVTVFDKVVAEDQLTGSPEDCPIMSDRAFQCAEADYLREPDWQ